MAEHEEQVMRRKQDAGDYLKPGPANEKGLSMSIEKVTSSVFLFLLARGSCFLLAVRSAGRLRDRRRLVGLAVVARGPQLFLGFCGRSRFNCLRRDPTFQPAHFGRVYAAYGGFLSSCLFCGVGYWMATSLIAMMWWVQRSV
jgi:hypothetical protein